MAPAPQIDPANPEALNEALSGAALFQPEDTPEQKAALARLETLLALVEGWVATVVSAAASNRLPQAFEMRRDGIEVDWWRSGFERGAIRVTVELVAR